MSPNHGEQGEMWLRPRQEPDSAEVGKRRKKLGLHSKGASILQVKKPKIAVKTKWLEKARETSQKRATWIQTPCFQPLHDQPGC